ncbi:putative transporter [anaerobic digester metagenome]
MGIDAVICLAVFSGLVICITANVIHMTLAALIGVSILLLTGIITPEVSRAGILAVHPINSLFVGSMVLIRCLEPTRVFPAVAAALFRLSGGDGRRVILLLFGIVTPLCALFPNATVVLLLTPLCIELGHLFHMPAVPLICLLIFLANTSGLLTLVGGVPSFIVGSAMGMDYLSYLREAAPGGLIAVTALLICTPLLFPAVWGAGRKTRLVQRASARNERIENPKALTLLLLILVAAILSFLFGQHLPKPIPPVATAVVAGTLALVVAQLTGLAHFGQIIRSIDWETILFFDCVFLIAAAMEASGVFTAVGHALSGILGPNAWFTALWLLFTLGAVSSVMPNIPLAAVMVPTLTAYLTDAGFLASPELLAAGAAVTPEARAVMLAMLFGVTLGGNATIIGAVPNIIAITAARKAGESVTFGAFARLGVPVAFVQLAAVAVWICLKA